MGLSVQTVAATHAPDHGRGDAFGIRHRFVGRHVVGQIVFVDATEGSQECTQAGARTFTTVAVNLAHPSPSSSRVHSFTLWQTLACWACTPG